MTGTGTITKIWLSGAIVTALLLAFFVPCSASTDVYYLRPQANTHNNSYNSVSQTFVSTCDSITKIAFFLGQNTGNSNYLMEIDSAGIAKGGVLTLSASLAKAYAENEGTYGTPVPLKRGYTYTLRISRQTPSHKVDFYYLADTMAYPWGKITDPIVTGDLCARVIGRGRVLNQWGMNLYGENWGPDYLATCGARFSELGVKRERDQIYLQVNNKNGGHAFWYQANPCSLRWDMVDPIIEKMALNNVEVILNPFGSSYEAACIDTINSGTTYLHHWIARIFWAMFYPPVKLREPVIDPMNPNAINPNNYWAKFFYKLLQRYGPVSTAPNGDQTGIFWTQHPGLTRYPVKYWELDNEANMRVAWGNMDTTWEAKMYEDCSTRPNLFGTGNSPGVANAFPIFDYNTHNDSVLYFSGTPGRQEYWMGLYIRQCIVADSVLHFLYPNQDTIKILTHSAHCINRNSQGFESEGLGRNWIRKFYQMGGKPYSDGIAYHAYQDFGDGHRFIPQDFQADYDTVRSIMKANSDNGLCWAMEQGWGTTENAENLNNSSLYVRHTKQADCIAQMYTMGASLGASPYGPLGYQALYQLRDYSDADTVQAWLCRSGVVNSAATTGKQSYYAFKQANTKLKDKYFNRRVPLADTNVYCYEFQKPGPDTAKKTWVVWRADNHPRDTVYIPVRTSLFDTVKVSYSATAESLRIADITPGGFAIVSRDSVPLYIHEAGTPSRPDIIVDSLYTYPSYPKAGDYVFFYARLKNIGSTTLSANLGNAVKFQVDGVTKATYTDSRAIMKDSTIIVGYNPYPPPGDGSIYDWKATWGDHLIRAWADSADKYVELREDNNQAFIFRHMAPSGKLIIRSTGYNQGYPTSGRKFTDTRYDTLSLLSNGGTIPHADSVRIKNEGGSWKPWRRDTTYWLDTLPTNDGKKRVYAQWKMAPSETSASVLDSIILDQTVPVAQVSSPAHGAMVSGTITLYGSAHDNYGYFRFDTLRYYRNTSLHDTIHVSLFPVGEMPPPAALGTWNTTLVTPGLTKETLAVYDSAGNIKRDSITLNVYNNQTDGGANWATGFGTYSSSVMNVATDPGGNVYLAETQNSKVRKYSPRKDSLFAFSARRGNDTTGLNWAVSMALKDSTTLYVVDGYAHCTKAFDRQGNLLLRFGSFGSGQGQFRQPCGIALDPKGRVFVVDRLNHRVQVFSDTSGAFLFQFGGQGQDSGKFNSPTGIAITLKNTLLGIAQDLIWVSDTKNNQIQVFDSLGNYLKTIKQPDTLGFDTPTGICSDKWGDIYVADTKHNRIVELNPYGQRILDFGGLGDSLWQFRNPIGVATSPGAHYLYVADMGNRRVQRFTVILEDSSGGGPQSGEIALRIPLVYSLAQSHPNPTTGEALIEYGLPKESPVRLVIYNVAGQVVREFKPGKQEAGFYTYKWDGRSNLGHRVGAGVYFYRLTAGSWVKTRKIVVIR